MRRYRFTPLRNHAEIQLRRPLRDSERYTLHNTTFGFPYRLGPSFSTPYISVPPFPVLHFQSPRLGVSGSWYNDGGIVFNSVCGCVGLFACQRNNSWTVRDIIIKCRNPLSELVGNPGPTNSPIVGCGLKSSETGLKVTASHAIELNSTQSHNHSYNFKFGLINQQVSKSSAARLSL